jgi:hypothetical protein
MLLESAMLPPLHIIWHRISPREIVTFVMGTIYFLKKLYGKWVRRSAKSWPIAQGTIEHVRARTLDQDEGKGWVGELAYSYSVNGEYFAGFHHFTARNESHANELIEGWKDRKVMVRYRMDQPGMSALLLDEQQPAPFSQNLKTLPWIANPS